MTHRRRLARALTFAAVATALATAPCAAQSDWLSAYYLNVGGVSGASPLGPGGWSDFQRLRLMAVPAFGPLRLEAAYEQLLLFQQRPGAAFAAVAPGAAPAPGDWLGLDWTLRSRGDVAWRHRFDRLDVAVPAGKLEVRLGRQAVSWATTLLLTPADPFAPFDPSDPFREYRPGVDAARLQLFPGAFSSVDVVLRPVRTDAGRSLTAAARAKMTVGAVDLSAWGGVLYGAPAAAVGATGTVAGAAWRAELAVREDSTRRAVLRGAVGLDRRWTAFGRDLYAVVEYQRDGYGAGGAAGLTAVLLSAPYRRGDLQVLGRDVVAAQARYQVHPLVAAEALILWDLDDGSAIAGPAVALSASNDVALRAGAFLPAGPRFAGPAGIGSEFGAAPTFAYASLSVFF